MQPVDIPTPCLRSDKNAISLGSQTGNPIFQSKRPQNSISVEQRGSQLPCKSAKMIVLIVCLKRTKFRRKCNVVDFPVCLPPTRKQNCLAMHLLRRHGNEEGRTTKQDAGSTTPFTQNVGNLVPAQAQVANLGNISKLVDLGLPAFAESREDTAQFPTMKGFAQTGAQKYASAENVDAIFAQMLKLCMAILWHTVGSGWQFLPTVPFLLSVLPLRKMLSTSHF